MNKINNVVLGFKASCFGAVPTPRRIDARRLRPCFFNSYLRLTVPFSSWADDQLSERAEARALDLKSERLPPSAMRWHAWRGMGRLGMDDALRSQIDEQVLYGDNFHFEDDKTTAASLDKWRSEISAAMRKKQPDALMGILISAEKAGRLVDLLGPMPPSFFAELLRSLEPHHLFVNLYQDMYREFGPEMARQLGIVNDDPSGQYGSLRLADFFVKYAIRILEVRAQSWPACLATFKYFLRCARYAGNTSEAEKLWRSLKRTHLLPDTESLNHYLAARCLDNERANTDWRYRLRYVPKNYALRSQENPPYEIRGHRLGPGGIKPEAWSLYHELIDNGFAADEETFCHLMTALAREGDLKSVAFVLQEVWAIDVELIKLNTQRGAPRQPARPHTRDSPLHPSDQLLFTLAHVYGTNGRIPTAIRLIDYVSREYTIPISNHVWEELLNWTFCTAHRRKSVWTHAGKVIDDGANIPRLSMTAVECLWQTMVSTAYEVSPTVSMYNYHIISLIHRFSLARAKTAILAAYKVMEEDAKNFRRATQLVKTTYRHHDITAVSPLVKDQQQREYLYYRLRVHRNRLYIKRWVVLLIKRESMKLKRATHYSRFDTPNIILRWARFLPSIIEYSMPSGEVALELRPPQPFPATRDRNMKVIPATNDYNNYNNDEDYEDNKYNHDDDDEDLNGFGL